MPLDVVPIVVMVMDVCTCCHHCTDDDAITIAGTSDSVALPGTGSVVVTAVVNVNIAVNDALQIRSLSW